MKSLLSNCDLHDTHLALVIIMDYGSFINYLWVNIIIIIIGWTVPGYPGELLAVLVVPLFYYYYYYFLFLFASGGDFWVIKFNFSILSIILFAVYFSFFICVSNMSVYYFIFVVHESWAFFWFMLLCNLIPYQSAGSINSALNLFDSALLNLAWLEWDLYGGPNQIVKSWSKL